MNLSSDRTSDSHHCTDLFEAGSQRQDFNQRRPMVIHRCRPSLQQRLARWSYIFAGPLTNTPTLASRSFSKLPAPELMCNNFNHQLLHQTCPSMFSTSLQWSPPNSPCLYKQPRLSKVCPARFQKSLWVSPTSSVHVQSKTKGQNNTGSKRSYICIAQYQDGGLQNGP